MSTVIEQQGGDVTEGGKGGKGLLMVGAGVGAALLIGGGAWAATNFFGGGGDQPDSVLPASAAMYARVDLDPAAGEKVAAVRFFQGLDAETKARLNAGEWREYVWEKLTEEGGNPAGLDYEKDIKPWLGDRLGIAVMPGTEEPLPVVALQVKDGEKALETMDRLKAAATEEPMEMDYWVADDYLVMTQAGQADAVKAAVEAGTLDELDTFRSDMDDLGNLGIASYWYDMERFVDMADEVSALAEEGVTELGAAGTVNDLSAGLTDAQKELMTGRNAGTVRLNPDSIEVHGIGRGVQGLAMPSDGGTARIVNELPADTVVALSLENGDDWVQSVWDAVGKLDPDSLKTATDEAAASGFTLPDDIKTVLGDSMSLSVGPGIVEAANTMSGTETGLPALPIAYRVQTDATKVNTLLSDAGLPPTTLAQRTDDGILTLGLHQPYVDGAATAGDRLGDNAGFKAAVADADKAQSIFYVNVNEFEKDYLPLIEDENARTALETLGAVGYSVGVDNESDSHFTLRFVADQK
ncbi:DUF3352 domain-containing protein [Ornithinimicrobium panacihumi]|uniref:DUF3352 domain-containing protein n=1 Tax=Ornithinimicrobium panacihumi TaxID=2008449 RepID=UPI003F8A9155